MSLFLAVTEPNTIKHNNSNENIMVSCDERRKRKKPMDLCPHFGSVKNPYILGHHVGVKAISVIAVF